jgi:hypothetical protein
MIFAETSIDLLSASELTRFVQFKLDVTDFLKCSSFDRAFIQSGNPLHTGSWTRLTAERIDSKIGKHSTLVSLPNGQRLTIELSEVNPFSLDEPCVYVGYLLAYSFSQIEDARLPLAQKCRVEDRWVLSCECDETFGLFVPYPSSLENRLVTDERRSELCLYSFEECNYR